MPREGDLNRRREDPDLTALGVVHEHRLAEPEVRRRGLPVRIRHRLARKKDAKRVSTATAVPAEHPQHVQIGHANSSTEARSRTTLRAARPPRPATRRSRRFVRCGALAGEPPRPASHHSFARRWSPEPGIRTSPPPQRREHQRTSALSTRTRSPAPSTRMPPPARDRLPRATRRRCTRIRRRTVPPLPRTPPPARAPSRPPALPTPARPWGRTAPPAFARACPPLPGPIPLRSPAEARSLPNPRTWPPPRAAPRRP